MSNLDTLIDTYVHNALSSTYTSLPAKVIKVNKEGDSVKSINCKPAVLGVYRDGVSYEYPTIYSVPVVFPSAGGGIISFPIQEGDTVLLLCSMVDIDNFMQGELESVVSTKRLHNLTDAIAITGLYPTKNNLDPSANDVEIKYAGSKVSIQSNGDMSLEAPTVRIKGALEVDGTVTNNGVNIGSTHTHQDSVGGNTLNPEDSPLNLPV